MLQDSEIASLRQNSRYTDVTKAGLKRFADDLVRQGVSDLKPNVSAGVKFIHRFAKARVVRRELYSCSTDLLERFLNYELAWPREPASVKEICETERDKSIWMRYDEQRVNALLSRCKALMSDADFRSLVKDYATSPDNSNSRLRALTKELNELHNTTILSIRTRGVFDNIVDLQRDVFYEANEDAIRQNFLEAGKSGNLGPLRLDTRDNNDE